MADANTVNLNHLYSCHRDDYKDLLSLISATNLSGNVLKNFIDSNLTLKLRQLKYLDIPEDCVETSITELIEDYNNNCQDRSNAFLDSLITNNLNEHCMFHKFSYGIKNFINDINSFMVSKYLEIKINTNNLNDEYLQLDSIINQIIDTGKNTKYKIVRILDIRRNTIRNTITKTIIVERLNGYPQAHKNFFTISGDNIDINLGKALKIKPATIDRTFTQLESENRILPDEIANTASIGPNNRFNISVLSIHMILNLADKKLNDLKRKAIIQRNIYKRERDSHLPTWTWIFFGLAHLFQGIYYAGCNVSNGFKTYTTLYESYRGFCNNTLVPLCSQFINYISKYETIANYADDIEKLTIEIHNLLNNNNINMETKILNIKEKLGTITDLTTQIVTDTIDM